jgi:hypothetical protein
MIFCFKNLFRPLLLKAFDKSPEIAQDFGSYSRRIKGRISGYAILDATQKTSRKTNKKEALFISESLNKKSAKLELFTYVKICENLRFENR